MLDWAVPNVAAALGPAVIGIAELRQEAAGGGRQWLGGGGGGGRFGGGGAGFRDHARQVLQSCFDPGWCLRFSSPTEWTVYEMACFLCFPLLCTETGSHSAFLLAGFGVLQYIDKVVDVGDAVALWRLVKEFHIFSTCCSRCLLGICTLFPEPLGLAATRPCALRQSTAALGRISSIFYVKSVDSELSAQFSPGKCEHYFIEQFLEVPRASVNIAFVRISHIFNVTVDSASLRSSHLKIRTLFLLAVIWRWEGFLGGSDAFFALLRVVPELSASFWSPRWRRVLCHRGLPLPIRTVVTWTYTHS